MMKMKKASREDAGKTWAQEERHDLALPSWYESAGRDVTAMV